MDAKLEEFIKWAATTAEETCPDEWTLDAHGCCKKLIEIFNLDKDEVLRLIEDLGQDTKALLG